jgi:aromatic-L-amino-acid decarboxylase
MAARIREHVRLAKLFGDWVQGDRRFELAAPISMGIVCLRFVALPNERLDAANSEIVERVNASGRAYLTQTKLRGHTAIRVGLGNVLTTERHLRNVWELIQSAASG